MSQAKDPKREALRQRGLLHPHPADVTDPLFRQHDFFDPRDLLQVKYEMLRRVQVEGSSVTAATAAFGFSRPVFYQALAAYQHHGLPGLLSQRPGPRRAHKLSDAVLDFVQQHKANNPTLRRAALADLIQDTFGLIVHPRSLERALARRRKRGH